ncbi:MAG TPA: GIY-YIG nuclease family protein [Candidatus Nitrosocosmicus sp.]|nr:GIY-YIG nuclease family protein [Candidatus Nitrosocosmicus sp.]
MIQESFIKTFPSCCGVYIFWQNKEPIYIGKANNIKVRLLSHFKNSQLDNKEAAIIQNSDNITFLETNSEFNALILEARLIQEHRPKYNVVWKDDKSYLYIKITIKDDFPKVLLHRKEHDKKSLYFGPFSSTRIARSLIYEIRRIIPFHTQANTSQRICFDAKIKLCDPCPNYIERIKTVNPTEYEELRIKYKSNIRKVISLLKGKSNVVLDTLEKDLKLKTVDQNYEEAMILRNKVSYLTTLIKHRSFKEFNLDYLIIDNYDEQLKSMNEFMKKYFNQEPDSIIRRIECYDISNLFGTNPTASMVVLNDGKPEKKSYRKFKIKTVTGISDFAMMEEVLKRRFKRTDWDLPSLIVMDGGKPQVRIGLKVKKLLNIDIPLIGIAKDPDRIVLGLPGLQTVYLEKESPFFQMIQHIRDESHRFAKKYHTYLRRQKLEVKMQNHK